MNINIEEVIAKRRSIRDYKQQEVPKDLLLELIKVASLAPSGSNIQPWYFIIINDKNVLENISAFSPGLLGNPPSIIVLCSDRREAFNKGGNLGRDILCLMDISMAAENLILLATKKGLGTCAVKSFNSRALKKILGLPDFISPDLIVSVGYAKKDAKSPKKKDLKEICFFNKWGGFSE